MALLVQIEQATGQIINSLESSSAISEVMSALREDIASIFPSNGETINNLDAIISIIDDIIKRITAKNASTAPSSGSNTSRLASELTDQEKALIGRVAHSSITNEAGQHVIKFLEPIVHDIENIAHDSIVRLEELSVFLKNARNQQSAIAVEPTVQ